MLVIKNANLLDYEKKMEILINGEGKYQEIGEKIDISAYDDCEIIDAENNLVTPTFVNTHMHFDKAYTAVEGRPKCQETLEDSIRIMHNKKRNYTVEDVKNRTVRAIKECVAFGTTKIRTNVDIDNMANLTALKGVAAAKEECKDICDLQIVAFPQEGIFNNKGTEKLMWEAMENGADVVGGMPAAEWLDSHSRRHVDLVFEIAKKYDALIDMHMDQSKDIFDRSLEYSAVKTMEEAMEGKVTGGHCTSIAYQNQSHADKVMELLKLADFNVCTNTQVLAIMGIDKSPRTRGVTRIREMVDYGINVATAQDTICDGFHLFGTGDPLDYGLICAYTAQYNTPKTAEIVFDMITKNSARIFNPDQDYGIAVGNDADLNIIEAPNVQEAFRTRASRKYVIKKGKVIANFIRKATLL